MNANRTTIIVDVDRLIDDGKPNLELSDHKHNRNSLKLEQFSCKLEKFEEKKRFTI